MGVRCPAGSTARAGRPTALRRCQPEARRGRTPLLFFAKRMRRHAVLPHAKPLTLAMAKAVT
jgi:hypothetical protein